jgi:hypothetical protein
VDLSIPAEVVYRDREYFGVPTKGHGAMMQRGTKARYKIGTGQAKERADIKEEGGDREGICCAQEGLQGRSRPGQDCT